MRSKNTGVLILLIIIGIIIGGIIGDLLGDEISFLARSYSIGLENPVHLDLRVLDLTFGLMINVNVASIVGLVFAVLVFRKL